MFVAQTNIALYEQMRQFGYGSEDISLMKTAYHFAAKARSVNLRGSGKPFVCHLVGTASLMVQLKQPVAFCVASLLHAMYLRGSDFGVGINMKGRRFIVKEAFGEDIEQIVYRYHKLKWRYSEAQIEELTAGHQSKEFETIVLMKLCNEAEDFLDNAVLYTGAGDDERKSAAWRLSYMNEAQAQFRAICHHLGVSALGDFIARLIDQSLSTEPVAALQSGHNKSYRNLGPSVGDRRVGVVSLLKVFRPLYYRNLMLNRRGARYVRKLR